ncbi:tyrosine-type recombinase/integrase [Falsirhodobacter halotolerans]|uniref:tyrosine-type recombinase/integrase n=1 Tax=Falsirhodobacter halotolerans TaxID=1146892 RepID=UPI001FD49F3E|nr:site-specific integrase [Falsirhodobacter halotolerans]MCJ8140259.1 tyrosine-type recombinase/integrase [Falsirhodobacter halotolerans]
MPQIAKELGVLAVKNIKTTGYHTVGGVPGLMLSVGAAGNRSWILRMTVGAKRREFGLGSFSQVSLADAREKARALRNKIDAGIDPVEEKTEARRRLKEKQRKDITFSEAVTQFLGTGRLNQYSNLKHRAQIASTLTGLAVPKLGTLAVKDITTNDVLEVLQPIWATKTETASRLRGRIENVLTWASVQGHRVGDNPARWKGNLDALLPSASKIKKESHHPALSVAEVPAWFAKLRSLTGQGALALQFLCLTGARSGEVRGARWSEIDLKSKTWRIPAERMKMGKEHHVPLSRAAVKFVSGLPREAGVDLMFPSRKQRAISDMTISAVMRRMQENAEERGERGWRDSRSDKPAVPHGLRSTFRVWIAENTTYSDQVAEAALAHKNPNAVVRAYQRSDLLEQRRPLMEEWATYLGAI